MDDLDRKILTLLQANADLALADIAEQVSLSTTPCWRRIQNLEKAGVIRARVALLDAAKINLGVTVTIWSGSNCSRARSPTSPRSSRSTG
jgi:Lrp/AsnC family transcriptional regulator